MQKDNSIGIRPVAWAASLIALASATAVTAKNWDAWSGPYQLEDLPGIERCCGDAGSRRLRQSFRDGPTIVFNSDRDGSHDIYVAKRSSTSDGFGAPVKLPAPINTDDGVEACPTLGPGNRLYFASFRDDPAGDLVVSKKGPNGWSTPVNLGPNINVNGMLEEAADFYEDREGRQVMIFTRRNSVEGDIYQSIDGGPASLVQGGPHSSAADARASVTNDGLTIFWDSNRTGTLGGPDLYYATRTRTSDPFGTAIHLSALSSPGFDARPFISKDGSFLTFSSNRTGSESPAPDMWFATREKVTGN